MAKKTKPSKSVNSQALNWLLIGGSLVTLFIWSNLNDPFNAPKSWILFIAGAYLTGWIAFQLKVAIKDPVLRLTTYLSGGFIFSLLLAFIFTDEKFVGFFGESARRTGFLTYFCLTIFLLASAIIFRLSNINKFEFVTLIVGSIVSLYGFLQHFKIDAIKWNNPYNSVLSTLGNPDFASAVMGIFLVLTVGILLNTSLKTWMRVWAVLSALVLTITIVFSQARQGLLAALIGIGFIVLIFIYQKSKKLGHAAIGIGALGLIVGIMGMLNQGPAAKYLYKISVTYRGDYWRAGINMFKHHFLFGVGLDRYGAYFRQYRDTKQVARRGPEIISNAAHNVPIQLASTGGIFVLMLFFALFILVVWRSTILIRKTSGNHQLFAASFVGAWITYEAQSFISIDNVGIAIWGWILGGLIIGLSIIEPEEKSSQKKSKENLLQPLISGLAATLALAVVIPLFLADSQARLARAYGKPTSAQMSAYVAAVKKPLTYGFQDPSNKILVGTLLVQQADINEGSVLLKSVVVNDSRSYQGLYVLALISEQTKNLKDAIGYRRQMLTLDPYNNENQAKLNEDLRASGK